MQMTPSTKTYNKHISKIIQKYTENSSRLYTGLELKKYWRYKVFNMHSSIQNEAIQSGRWSAYAHSSLLTSCNNLCNKHQITRGSRVWIHPLTDPRVIDTLVSYGAHLSSIDIQKETLQWDSDEIVQKFELAQKSRELPDLIVITSLTGLVEEIQKILQLAKQYTVPVLVIFNEGGLNFGILECMSMIKWGSVVFAQYPNALTSMLRGCMNDLASFDSSITNTEEYLSVSNHIQSDTYMYISFFIENRATSILEYHLQESDSAFAPLVDILQYCTMKKARNEMGIMKHVVSNALQFTDGKLTLKKMFNRSKFASPQDALIALASQIQTMQSFALPDIIFELELARQVNITPEGEQLNTTKLSDQCVDAQTKARTLHTYFTNQVAQRPSGTLEVPSFYFNRVYLRYFCYSTEPNYWKSEFARAGTSIVQSYPIHPLFLEKDHLPNTNFISRFLLLI